MAKSVSGGWLGLEMVSIFVAVVVGVAVGNWDADRRERNRAALAVERIQMELQGNLEGLSRAAPYYREMGQRLDSIVDAGGDRVGGTVSVPGWRGLSPPSIRRASFTVATSTGALEHVDFVTADAIAQAYEVLDDFSETMDQAIAGTMRGEFTRLSEWRLAFNIMGEVATIAERVVGQVVEALDRAG